MPVKIDSTVLERAEQAVAAMADSYLEWAAQDVGRLQAAVTAARARPDDPGPLRQLRQVAHEVRGQGGSFGFPLVSRIASSLDRLVRESATLSAVALDAVDAHIDALAAVIAERARGDGSPPAREIARGLEAAVERLIGGAKASA